MADEVMRTSPKKMVSPMFQGDDGSGQSAPSKKGMSTDEISGKLRSMNVTKPQGGDVESTLGS